MFATHYKPLLEMTVGSGKAGVLLKNIEAIESKKYVRQCVLIFLVYFIFPKFVECYVKEKLQWFCVQSCKIICNQYKISSNSNVRKSIEKMSMHFAILLRRVRKIEKSNY
jgi:hypothetical protein